MKRTTYLGFISLVFILLLTTASANARMKSKSLHGGKYWNQLDETQKTELQTKIDELKEKGADRMTVRKTVHEQLKNWGIDVPDYASDDLWRKGRRHGDAFKDLTEDQRNELHQLMQVKFNEWGIDMPEHPRMGFAPMGGGWMKDLNEEQRESVQNLIKSMREEDKNRKEIHDAVKTLVADYGIELPDEPQFRMHGKCGHLGHKSHHEK